MEARERRRRQMRWLSCAAAVVAVAAATVWWTTGSLTIPMILIALIVLPTIEALVLVTADKNPNEARVK